MGFGQRSCFSRTLPIRLVKLKKGKIHWRFFDAANAAPSGEIAPESILARWLVATKEDLRSDLARQLQSNLIAALQGGPEFATNQPDYKTFVALTSPTGGFWKEARGNIELLPPKYVQMVLKEKAELQQLRQQLGPNFPVAHAIQEGVPHSPHTKVFMTPEFTFVDGYNRLGDPVPRHFPAILGGQVKAEISQGSGRLELAKWIAAPENPMTARVMVNRIWQYHFGEGIVRTPNNFGKLVLLPQIPSCLIISPSSS